MKKILTLTLCLALLHGLFSGCGGKRMTRLAGRGDDGVHRRCRAANVDGPAGITRHRSQPLDGHR